MPDQDPTRTSERVAALTDNDDLGRLLTQAGQIKSRLDEAKAAAAEGKATSESVAELQATVEQHQAAINEWQRAETQRASAATIDAMLTDHAAVMDRLRMPSKAAAISAQAGPTTKPRMSFLTAIAKARSRDYDEQREGKDALSEYGVGGWQKSVGGIIGGDFSDGSTKATVGDSNAAGGFIVPNAVLTTIIEQATVPRTIVDLFTVVNGVTGNSVQIPFENSSISRATIVAAGVAKGTEDLVAGAYTATLYTLARILDVGNQLLRQSNGVAEAWVRSRLGRAFALGEDWYSLNGTGSSQPYGLLTAIGTAGPYVSTFSSPSNTTVAGSVISAVITATGALENRGANADGVVLNTSDYYLARMQGADAAGFWIDPFMTAPDAGTDATGPLGLRWRHSPTMPTDSLVVGEYRSAIFIRGQGYRVDVSDQAGTRWDANITGFRGEEEIAFDARPPVYAGLFQRIVNAVP